MSFSFAGQFLKDSDSGLDQYRQIQKLTGAAEANPQDVEADLVASCVRLRCECRSICQARRRSWKQVSCALVFLRVSRDRMFSLACAAIHQLSKMRISSSGYLLPGALSPEQTSCFERANSVLKRARAVYDAEIDYFERDRFLAECPMPAALHAFVFYAKDPPKFANASEFFQQQLKKYRSSALGLASHLEGVCGNFEESQALLMEAFAGVRENPAKYRDFTDIEEVLNAGQAVLDCVGDACDLFGKMLVKWIDGLLETKLKKDMATYLGARKLVIKGLVDKQKSEIDAAIARTCDAWSLLEQIELAPLRGLPPRNILGVDKTAQQILMGSILEIQYNLHLHNNYRTMGEALHKMQCKGGADMSEIKCALIESHMRSFRQCEFSLKVAERLLLPDDMNAIHRSHAEDLWNNIRYLQSCNDKDIFRFLSMCAEGSWKLKRNLSDRARLSTSFGEHFCAAGCGAKETPEYKFKVCARCKTTKYCSVSCQQQHWKSAHRAECGKRS